MWTEEISLETLKAIVQEAVAVKDSEDYWMVTWVDKIGLGYDGTPYYKASIHRIKSTELKDFKIESLDLSSPRFVVIPLRLLRIIPVGTLIKHGLILFKSHNTYLPTFTIDFNTERGFERTTLGRWKYGDSVLKKLSWHKLGSSYSKESDHRFAANSNISVYRHSRRQSANYDYVIFPSVELARFYWFPSTRLAHALLNGKAASRDLHNELYVPELTFRKSEDGVEFHQVIIRDKMHIRDRRFIARLAFDSDALYSANTIYQCVINTKLEAGNIGALYLDCEFPFKDDTTLQARGYIISLDTVNVLMITEIVKCWGPWPFDRLDYDRETERPQTDETKDKDGERRVPFPPEPAKPPESPKDENEEDTEDEFERIMLDRNPFIKDKPGFDHSKRNNSTVRNVQYSDVGSRFPTMPKEGNRLDRFRKIPPKHEKPTKSKLIDNISTSENTQSGGTSTGLDIVSDEKDGKEKFVDFPAYVSSLVKYFVKKGAKADFINTLEGVESDTTPWYQPERILLSIQITDLLIIDLYMIYIRLKGAEFILCWMDKDLKTSMKIVTKYRIDNKEISEDQDEDIIRFYPEDIEDLVVAMQDNYKTMGKLNADKNGGFRVKRLYNTGDKGLKSYYDRMLDCIEYKDLDEE